MSMEFRYQVASDIRRDGLGVELVGNNQVLAEIFRCDADNSLTLSVFVQDIPFIYVEKLVGMARSELTEFEDGSPLPEQFEIRE
jgi:hypothetical protein